MSVRDIILAASAAPKEPNFWIGASYTSAYTIPAPGQQVSSMSASPNGCILSWSVEVVSGYYQSTAILRDIDGNILWSKLFTSTLVQYKWAMIGCGSVDASDDSYITLSAYTPAGAMLNQIFKVAKNGSVVWSKQLRSISGIGLGYPIKSISHTDGNVYITAKGHNSYEAAFFYSFTPGGILRFAVSAAINTANPVTPYDMAINGTTVIIAGYKGTYAVTTTSGSTAVPQRYMQGSTLMDVRGIAINNDGSFWFAGTRSTGNGMVLAKFNSAGDSRLFQINIGTGVSYPINIHDLQIGVDGNLYIIYASAARGNFDNVMASFTQDGIHRFTTVLYGTNAAQSGGPSIFADTINSSFYACLPAYVSAANGFANIVIKGRSTGAATYKTFQPIAGNTIQYSPSASQLSSTTGDMYTGSHGITLTTITSAVTSEAAQNMAVGPSILTTWSSPL